MTRSGKMQVERHEMSLALCRYDAFRTLSLIRRLFRRKVNYEKTIGDIHHEARSGFIALYFMFLNSPPTWRSRQLRKSARYVRHLTKSGQMNDMGRFVLVEQRLRRCRISKSFNNRESDRHFVMEWVIVPQIRVG